MSVLLVRRTADTAARYRKMDVLVDGRVVGRLKRKEELSLDLPAGPHVVQGRMDWTTSRVVGAEPSAVALGYSLTAMYRMMLQPSDAIDIDLEAGTLSERQVPVVDREKYGRKTAVSAVVLLVVSWLSQTSVVPFAVNVVMSIVGIVLALYFVTQVSRLIGKYRQLRSTARAHDE